MRVELIRIPRGVLVGSPPARRGDWIAIYADGRAVLENSAAGHAIVFDTVADLARAFSVPSENGGARSVTVDEIRNWRPKQTIERALAPCLACRRVHAGACR